MVYEIGKRDLVVLDSVDEELDLNTIYTEVCLYKLEVDVITFLVSEREELLLRFGASIVLLPRLSELYHVRVREYIFFRFKTKKKKSTSLTDLIFAAYL